MTAPLVPPELRCIEAIEDSYVAGIKASPIGALLRAVESIPQDMSAQEVGDRLKTFPGAFVRFNGGPSTMQRSPTIDGEFTVFCTAGQGVKETQRRRGTAVSVGAYQIAQAVFAGLNGSFLPTPEIGDPLAPIDGLIVGAVYAVDLRPFVGEELDIIGLSIFGVTFRQRITFPPITPAGIEPFVTFKGQITDPAADDGGGTLPLPDGAFEEEADVTLPQ